MTNSYSLQREDGQTRRYSRPLFLSKDAAMTDEQIQELRDWRKHIPDLFNGSYRKLWDKAVERKSMKAAVNSKCLDCMCWQQAEVKRCEVITCPLWSYRPYQDKAQKAVSAHRRLPRVGDTE